MSGGGWVGRGEGVNKVYWGVGEWSTKVLDTEASCWRGIFIYAKYAALFQRPRVCMNESSTPMVPGPVAIFLDLNSHKELIPIVLATAVWGHHWAGLRIRCLCDNMAVVFAVNKGSARDPPSSCAYCEHCSSFAPWLWNNSRLITNLSNFSFNSEQNCCSQDLIAKQNTHSS